MDNLGSGSDVMLDVINANGEVTALDKQSSTQALKNPEYLLVPLTCPLPVGERQYEL